MTLGEVAAAIHAYRFTYSTEAQLEDGIAEALERQGYEVLRQVVLDDGLGRLDLLVGRICIEVKIAGQTKEVGRQLSRYMRSPLIDGIVLVTGRALHSSLASETIEVVTLGRNAL